MRLYPRSAVEFVKDFGPIGLESVVECAKDASKWLGGIIIEKLDKADMRLADRYNDPDEC